MKISTDLANLAGFTAAHALWNLSDLNEGELLCPMAFLDDGSGRELIRFEADTQEQTIEQGFQTLSEKVGLQRWAFAREGLIRTETGSSDVLIVEAWEKGMSSPLSFLQRYKPFAVGEFELLGLVEVLLRGAAQTGEVAELAIKGLRSGIFSHEKAAELWVDWRGW